MNKIKNPHDKVFKAAMTDKAVAKSFLENYLPTNIKKYTQWETLQLSPSSYIDKELQEQFSDLLYRVHIKNKESYLYVLLEHQSKPDPLMAFRLLEYQVKIWRQHLKQAEKKKGVKLCRLPLIYPIVYYTGAKKPYPYSKDLFDCFLDIKNAKNYLFKPFQLVDLTQIPDDKLKKNSLATGLMLIQKHIRDRDLGLRMYEMLEKGIWITILKHNGEYAEILLKYVLEMGDMVNPRQFFEQLAQAVPERGEEIMTGMERLRKEARKLGIQEGRQEGRQEERIKVAKTLLELGQPFPIIEKATGLSESDLLKIKEALH